MNERQRQGVRFGSTLASDMTSDATLVPVYVGVFHHRGEPWRLLVNGATGKVVGKRPWSRVKVAIGVSLFGTVFVSPCVSIPAIGLFLACWGLGLIDD